MDLHRAFTFDLFLSAMVSAVETRSVDQLLEATTA